MSEERLHSAVFSAGERRRNTKNSELSTRNAAEFPDLIRESRAPEAGYAGRPGNLAETGARRSNKFSGAGAERDERNWGKSGRLYASIDGQFLVPGIINRARISTFPPSCARPGPKFPDET